MANGRFHELRCYVMDSFIYWIEYGVFFISCLVVLIGGGTIGWYLAGRIWP
jgi:hypothetical protein